MLNFNKVTFSYPDGTLALKNISFTVEDGEFVFIIGPTGAGKTTILKLLIGEYKPLKGKIIFDDKELNNLKSWEKQLLRQKIGVIFQNKNLISELTIRENLNLRLELAGLKKRERQEKLKSISKRFQIEEKLNYFPSQLSSGEQRLVALARAVSIEPLLIFADEPTANLDPLSTWKVMKELVRINKEGVTVIVTSHNPEIVNKLRYRVLSLRKGILTSDKQEGYYVNH